MARNKISDLRDHLFAQLERLSDEEMSDDQLKREVDRSKAMANLSKNLIDSAKVEIEFLKETGAISSESKFFDGVKPEPSKFLPEK